MTQTVLVTGGNGFVASWCIADLLRRGYRVRTTVRHPDRAGPLVEALARQGVPTGPLSVHAADLTHDAGWAEAVQGCDYVLHVASPLGIAGNSDPEALATAARDGTLRVLRAAVAANVRRVVMTSAATTATPPLQSADSLSDESVWFDPDEADVDGYRRSKRLAERAAWEFMKTQGGGTELVTVLPGAVFGPLLTSQSIGSVEVIAKLLRGELPALPRLGLEVVDVRDLADIHVRAMTTPDIGGQRFLAVGEFLWMRDIAAVLRAQLGVLAADVPTRVMPDWVFRLLARVQPQMRAMVPRLGRQHCHNWQKARIELGWSARPARLTVLDCARSLHKAGLA
ncbi:NAD-dependent epimerase/dehydratase family protein [Stenotrophomonas sp. 24(2023)]|uniref:NAD-dependent epimerase/dehydratase family protein n=1 Tax=Stenotrophomonas sp. 24(2023) TaxID=3068324 RepID=UPI0027DF80DB|nr:NAD-dependent epimerase/dehydratase family protein [Stenotrophomonas sp. 24(2023)]WMJ69344.1 NAD-dependent epimerase/dehydratase family protein [Stenotrophomonas sp. 24(2023)]